MSPAWKAATVGAAVGFVVMMALLVFQVQSRLVISALWPTRVLFTSGRGTGTLWGIIFQVFSFFANIFLYGLIGLVIGKLSASGESNS